MAVHTKKHANTSSLLLQSGYIEGFEAFPAPDGVLDAFETMDLYINIFFLTDFVMRVCLAGGLLDVYSLSCVCVSVRERERERET